MKLFALILLLICTISLPAQTLAAYNPLSHPNNKIGMHVLFPTEIENVAKLVNTSGGQWGYILIPIQSGDKDITKWQTFMDQASQLHLTPIIRLATQGDYFNTKVWRKPNETDVLDFANFLNSLIWPTKNRYVIVYNEVNRGDEWGGAANAAEYANLLSYAATVFKSINQDFFIISGGMDNAAPNVGAEYINQYTYFQQMNDAVPGIFNQVDGFASHSYPNPGFIQPPTTKTRQSITSFSYEREFLSGMVSKKLPIFITETGWTNEGLSEQQRATYLKEALTTVWNDPDIVTVIPFILNASGPFAKFSFIAENGQETQQYKMLKDLPKTAGKPIQIIPRVLAATSEVHASLVSKEFKEPLEPNNAIALSKTLQVAFNWLLHL